MEMDRGLHMNKTLIILLAVLLAGTSLVAQNQAVLKEATGKVEIQTSGGTWQQVRIGMRLDLGTTISTGFNSSAVLDLGSSVLSVKPLTRMRLDQLLEQGGTVQTELFLRVGKVSAEVKSAAGLKQDFKLRSPVSTAAVRGTDFDYDTYGVHVEDGNVYYFNLLNQGRTYGSGEGGGSDGYNSPPTGDQSKNENSTVDPYAPGAGGTREGGSFGATDTYLTGGISIVIPPPLVDPQ